MPDKSTLPQTPGLSTSRKTGLFLALAAAVTGAALAWKRFRPEPFIPTPQMHMSTLTNATHNNTTGTALITGASSGIGAAFARKLAAQGYHLILVARREERLVAVANEIQAQHPVKGEILAADLAKPEEVQRVVNRIVACDDLTMLINNAGFGMFGAFADVDISRHLDMIHVHVIASVRLTRAALPDMIARNHGTIINVSSIAAFLPRPNNVTYNATKMYLKTFTEGLHAELSNTNLTLQALFPGLTRSEFFDRPEIGGKTINVPNFLWMSSEEVVEESLKSLRRNHVICLPGLKNRIMLKVLQNTRFLALIRKLISYKSSKTAPAST
jgi:hypothetical protein